MHETSSEEITHLNPQYPLSSAPVLARRLPTAPFNISFAPLQYSQAHAFADAMRETSSEEISHWASVADSYQHRLHTAEDQLAATAHELAEVRARATAMPQPRHPSSGRFAHRSTRSRAPVPAKMACRYTRSVQRVLLAARGVAGSRPREYTRGSA
jgi:hypothetical protein